MIVVTWNVNSIRSRLGRLLAMLERHRPDIVCLQELKVEEKEFPFLPLEAAGYRAAVHGQKTYNGVAILGRREPTEIVRGFPEDDDPQARLLAATVGGTRVLSAYVPNGSVVGSEKYAYKLAWLDRLEAYLDAEGLDRPLLLCGDLNIAPQAIDVDRPERWEASVLFHPDMRERFRRILDRGLIDTLRLHHDEGGLYSWWDYRRLAFPKNHGLRIDHVLATRTLAERCTGASIDREERKGKQPSDHAPVLAVFDEHEQDAEGP